MDEYRDQLKARLTSRKSTIFNLSDITRHETYKAWRRSKQSRTLILRGRTAARTPLSWLSPAAVELVDRLRDDDEGGTSVVVYHFCKREGMYQDDPMHTVISRIIYQLLEAKPSILQDRATYQEYATRFKSDKWQQKHLKTACELCVSILNHFELVYLILDRPEECIPGGQGLSKLLEAAQEAKCVLKTFVVVDKDRTLGCEVDDWKEAALPDTVDVIDDLDQ